MVTSTSIQSKSDRIAMSETVNDTMGSCPICALRMPIVPRHPRALCARCSGEIAEETGRRLEFFNTSISGGFEAHLKTLARHATGTLATFGGSDVTLTKHDLVGSLSNLKTTCRIGFQVTD